MMNNRMSASAIQNDLYAKFVAHGKQQPYPTDNSTNNDTHLESNREGSSPNSIGQIGEEHEVVSLAKLSDESPQHINTVMPLELRSDQFDFLTSSRRSQTVSPIPSSACSGTWMNSTETQLHDRLDAVISLVQDHEGRIASLHNCLFNVIRLIKTLEEAVCKE